MSPEQRHIESTPSIEWSGRLPSTEHKELTPSSLCRIHSPVAYGHTREILKTLYPNKQIVLPRQVHGAEVRYVDRSSEQVIPDCDGLITDDPLVVLGARGADCPIVIATAGRVRGIMHSGWKGTLLGAPGELISAMEQQGIDAKEISVYVSPGIRQCCYEIPLEDVPHGRIRRFQKKYPEIAVIYRDTHIYIDLQRAIRASLIDQGVPLEHIDVDRRCTCCHPRDDRSTETPFPSARREGDARSEGLVATIADSTWQQEAYAQRE